MEGRRIALTREDRTAGNELISLHGHLVDDGSLDRLGGPRTAAVRYDLTDFGQGLLTDVAADREAAPAPGTTAPVAHHVTDAAVTDPAADADAARP
ncbi:hypothetical protein [Streptomyces sulfonofaciens]|uniref:hypothetical protein n=1 Tax=Streptomyces sulfonofaciens TaxID=68272 RepID=UPI001676F8F0|nr:hypothetical protein [Streptomyces sulfonofaciens]